MLKTLFRATWFQLTCLAICILLAYGPSVTAPFIWDDEVMVVGNGLIRPESPVSSIFTSSAFGEAFDGSSFYRPLQILSYKVDFSLWGLSPAGYRATSILIHFLSMTFLLLCLRKLSFSKSISFLLTLIYAVHPLAIEAVTYIAGRGDAMMMLFSLISFYCFLQKKNWAILCSILFYILAVFTKENAVILPGFMMAYALWVGKKETSFSAWISFMVTFLIGALYSIFRIQGVMHATSRTLSWIADTPFLIRLLSVPRIILTYIQLFLFPMQLHMEYHFVETSLNTIYIWLGLPVLFAVVFATIKWHPKRDLMLFFWAVFFIGLLPVLNVFSPLASTLREHWLYLPGLGLLGVFGLCLDQLKWQQVKVSILILFGIFLLGSTVLRNQDWMDPLRLYAHDLALEPRSFLLHNNLGVTYFRSGDLDFALREFMAAIENSPGKKYGISYNNVGAVLEQKNQIQDAVNYYLASIRLSQYELGYVNVSKIYLRYKRPDLARPILIEGLREYPHSSDLNLLRKMVP